MTLQELARLNKAHKGHFFNHDTMAHFGDTMKSFTIKTVKTKGIAVVTRKKDGREWNFDVNTGRLSYALEVQAQLSGTRQPVKA